MAGWHARGRLAGFVFSYAKLDKYNGQIAEMDRLSGDAFNFSDYGRASARAERWRQVAILSGFTAVAGAAITAFVWVNPPMKRLTIQPEKSGASVSFLSRF